MKKNWSKIFNEKSLIKNDRIKNQLLSNIFTPISIRRTKKIVKTQINLYDVEVTIKLLKFSKFENAIYIERRKPIVLDIMSMRNDSDIAIAKNSIEILRKGCCHPQVYMCICKYMYAYYICICFYHNKIQHFFCILFLPYAFSYLYLTI